MQDQEFPNEPMIESGSGFEGGQDFYVVAAGLSEPVSVPEALFWVELVLLVLVGAFALVHFLRRRSVSRFCLLAGLGLMVGSQLQELLPVIFSESALAMRITVVTAEPLLWLRWVGPLGVLLYILLEGRARRAQRTAAVG